MRGRVAGGEAARQQVGGVGLREGEMKLVSLNLYAWWFGSGKGADYIGE